jgi:hypothetical protein
LPSGIPSAKAQGAGPNYQFDGKLTFFCQPGCLFLRQLVDFLIVVKQRRVREGFNILTVILF